MKKIIGKVTATVEFDLIEGDKTNLSFVNWFQYREPGITPDGKLGTCTRDCRVVTGPSVELFPEEVAVS